MITQRLRKRLVKAKRKKVKSLRINITDVEILLNTVLNTCKVVEKIEVDLRQVVELVGKVTYDLSLVTHTEEFR